MGRAYDFDLITIGAGSGGVRASRVAASLGVKVAVAEEREIGGTCVNLGCVPKKLLGYAAHFADDFEDAASFGWDVQVQGFDWARLIENKNSEIKRLNGIYQQVLDRHGVVLLKGRARLVDNHTVEVNGKTFTTERILVATGSSPVVPKAPGSELAVTSNEMFHLPQIPDRIVIAGGGYIAVEFASIMKGCGVDVTLVHRRDLVLRGFDGAVRQRLTDLIAQRGIQARMGCTIESVEPGLRVTLSNGEVVEAGVLLCALGRRPNIQGLGLEALGVAVNDGGAIVVDDHYRTSVSNVFALGDVIDRVTLTPVAIAEAMAFVRTVYEDQPTVVDYKNIASAVFSIPPVACVGLSEEDARHQLPEVHTFSASFAPLRSTLTPRSEKTFMKLVVDRTSDKVVGCHMVGPDAPEIMQGVAVAIKAGATKATFDATVGIHPTAAEEFVTMSNPD